MDERNVANVLRGPKRRNRIHPIRELAFDPRAHVNDDGVVNVIDLATVARQLPTGAKCPSTIPRLRKKTAPCSLLEDVEELAHVAELLVAGIDQFFRGLVRQG